MNWFQSRRQNEEPPDVVVAIGEVREALQLAREAAAGTRLTVVSPEIILLALLSRERFEACRVLAALDVRPSELTRELSRGLRTSPGPHKNPDDIPYSSRARRILAAAVSLARELSQEFSTVHLLLAISGDGDAAGKLLRNRGATPDQIRARLKRDSAPEVQLEITIDDNSDRQIYDQIVSQIREAVATSQLKPGDRLPAIRRLADQLGIAPGTVARAYAELETGQVIITDGPKGTYVAEPPLPTPPSVRPIAMRDLFRPVVVAAFHLGASAEELRRALEEAMKDIYPSGEESPAT